MNYFISRTRYKCAFVCVTGAGMIAINELLKGVPILEFLNAYGVTITFLLIAGIFLWYPAYTYAAADASELWHKWGAYGEKESKEFTDVKFERIYPKTKYGLLKDPIKGYRISTTLLNCTCADFRESKTPCKHMHKLAELMGVYQS